MMGMGDGGLKMIKGKMGRSYDEKRLSGNCPPHKRQKETSHGDINLITLYHGNTDFSVITKRVGWSIEFERDNPITQTFTSK